MRYERAADAFAAARTLNDAIPLSHLEILSPAVAASFEPTAKFLLFAGFSGSSPEIDYQAEKIRTLLGADHKILEDGDALRQYQHLRDIDFHAKPLSAQIAVPPARLATTLDSCASEFRAHAGLGVAQVFLVDEVSTRSSREAVARWREVASSAAAIYA